MAEVELIAENDFDPDPDNLKHIIRNNPDLDARFREIVGNLEIIPNNEVQNERRRRVTPNGDLTIFYRYFFTKYISVCQGTDARSGMIDRHASIFPFKTQSDLQVSPVAVTALFDDDFSSEIREFVVYHFGNTFDLEHLRDLFLTNIDQFKRQHFRSPPSHGQLTRIIGLGSNRWRADIAPEYLSDYFNDFIRLNDSGAVWYEHFQTKFNIFCDLYERPQSQKVPEKSELYFRYLPEINCCELLLLLETDYYRQSHTRRTYNEIFKKYLFFFGHAIRSADPHPVCFIDEALFKCLQFKKKYETFRGDIVAKLQWELWMMTLVHRRKHPLPDCRLDSEKPDEDSLRDVIEYANRSFNIESAIVNYGEPQYHRFKILTVFDDVAFLIGYSGRQVGERFRCDRYANRIVGNGFSYGEVLKCALISREIRTITYYNAYLGLENQLEMPQNGAAIRDFIRELSELYRPGPLFPERFLIHNLENYFEILPPAARKQKFS